MIQPDTILDYLQTQGLKLPVQDVQVACIAAETVMIQTQAAIEPTVLWQNSLLDTFLPRDTETEALLRQVFLSLDASLERLPRCRAAIYLKHSGKLVRLYAHNSDTDLLLPLTEDRDPAARHPAIRSAQTGWLYQIDDIHAWHNNGDLTDPRHAAGQGSLLAAPICTESGSISGILYAEHPDVGAWSGEILSQLLGLAIALHPVLHRLQTDNNSPSDNQD